jgi:hypothetical protein
VSATTPSADATPESYLGSARAERFTGGAVTDGTHGYGRLPAPGPSELAYGGRWTIAPMSATAGAGAALALRFQAQHVYLVLGSPGAARSVRVLLDGRPIPASVAGADVHGGTVRVNQYRLYSLVSLRANQSHLLTLRPQAGVQGYAFTFG